MATAEINGPAVPEAGTEAHAQAMPVPSTNGRPVVVEPDLEFIRALQQSGGDSLKKCMQCGNCSAACPLSPDDRPFPRKEMAWAALGHEGTPRSGPRHLALSPLQRLLHQLPPANPARRRSGCCETAVRAPLRLSEVLRQMGELTQVHPAFSWPFPPFSWVLLQGIGRRSGPRWD